MNRGEIWLSKRTPYPVKRGGRRMVLLLSWDAGQQFRDRVTVAAITTRVRGIDAEVFLDQDDGVDEPCVANLDVMNTVLLTDLDSQVCLLREDKMLEVELAIHYAFGLSLPCRFS